MNTLYFTPSEQKVFSSLSSELQGSWSVELERLTYADTPKRRAFRFQMLRVQDPALVQFREKALVVKNEQEFAALAATVDLKAVSNKDLTHIVFALGPDAMTMIIADLLESAKNQEDMELAAACAALRHGMLESFAEVSFAHAS